MSRRNRSYISFILQISFLLITMVGVTTYLLYWLNVGAEAAIEERVDEHVTALAEAVHVALASNPSSLYLDEFIQTHPLPSIVHLIFITDNRNIITDSTNQAVYMKKIVTAGPLTDPEHEITFEQLISQTGPEPRAVQYYIFPYETTDGERLEKLNIHVLLSWESIPDILAITSRNRLFAMTGMLAVTAILLIWLVWRFTRPITDLLTAERRVARGDFDFQLRVRRHDEIGSLAETFNEMVNALKRNRQLEEQLRDVEHAAAIGRLASGIAHEIRNPLNFINLSIDHVRSHFHPARTDERTQFEQLLDSIKSEIGRLNRLVTDFLWYGRPTKLVPQPIDPNKLVRDVVSPITVQAREQKIKVVVCDNPTIPYIEGDPELLRTCLSNLVINGLQAMPEGGQLKIVLEPKENSVCIAVSDTGIGISMENQEKIFEPYYSSKDTGIGLGLAVTKKIIQDHGGKITVESAVNKGSTFTLTLPQSETNTPAAETERVPIESIHPGRNEHA